MDIKDLRKDIDDIDSEIIPLLVRRMEAARDIALYKKKHNLPITDEKRENEIFAKVGELGGEYGEALKTVYSSITDASRNLQKIIINGEE